MLITPMMSLSMPMMSEILNNLKKNSRGFYEKSDIEKLEPSDFIKLLVQETSYQSTMNIVRSETERFQNKASK